MYLKDCASKNRIDYVDVAKGIGILLVLWGHISVSGLGNDVIYAFHMPLFFFISGLLFIPEKYDSFKRFVIQRSKSLLIPYAVFSVATWIIWFCYNSILENEVVSYWEPLLQTIISQGSGGYLVHNSPLWFVTCLFVVEMMYFFVNRITSHSKVVFWSIVVVLAIIGNLMIKQGSPLRYLPWSVDMALCALPFYALGNVVSTKIGHAKLKAIVKSKPLLSVAVGAFLIVLLVFGAKVNGPVSMGHRYLGNYTILFYLVACVGILVALILSILFEDIPNKLIQFLKWCGRSSFNFMAIQAPIKGVVIVVVSKLLNSDVAAVTTSDILSLIAFAFSLVIICCVSVVIDIIKCTIKGRKV